MSRPVKLTDEQLENWNRMRRPSDAQMFANGLGCTKQLYYDAFYRKQTSQRVYDALCAFYARRAERIEEQLRKADYLNLIYETSQQ